MPVANFLLFNAKYCIGGEIMVVQLNTTTIRGFATISCACQSFYSSMTAVV